jgi:hypothetical protein
VVAAIFFETSVDTGSYLTDVVLHFMISLIGFILFLLGWMWCVILSVYSRQVNVRRAAVDEYEVNTNYTYKNCARRSAVPFGVVTA